MFASPTDLYFGVSIRASREGRDGQMYRLFDRGHKVSIRASREGRDLEGYDASKAEAPKAAPTP